MYIILPCVLIDDNTGEVLGEEGEKFYLVAGHVIRTFVFFDQHDKQHYQLLLTKETSSPNPLLEP